MLQRKYSNVHICLITAFALHLASCEDAKFSSDNSPKNEDERSANGSNLGQQGDGSGQIGNAGELPNGGSPPGTPPGTPPAPMDPNVKKTRVISVFMEDRDYLPVTTLNGQPLDISVCITGDFTYNIATKEIIGDMAAADNLGFEIMFHPGITAPAVTSHIAVLDAATKAEISSQKFANKNGAYQTNFSVKKGDQIKIGITSGKLSTKKFHTDPGTNNWPRPIIKIDAPCMVKGDKFPNADLIK